MKTLLVIFLLVSFKAHAQSLDDASTGDLNLDTEESENLNEDTEMDEPDVVEEQEEQDDVARSGKDVIHVECRCPEPVQAEEANPFPPNSVFFMAPQPAPVPTQQEVAPKDESIPPGYGGKMNSGYDDTGYKQIQ